MNNASLEREIKAAITFDWTQVVLNGGPPCFHIEDDNHGRFCGRAKRWEGHGNKMFHEFVSFEAFLLHIAGEIAMLRQANEAAVYQEQLSRNEANRLRTRASCLDLLEQSVKQAGSDVTFFASIDKPGCYLVFRITDIKEGLPVPFVEADTIEKGIKLFHERETNSNSTQQA